MNLPWKAERRVEPDEARRLIQGQFPDLAKESLQWLGEGWDNTVYLVDGRWVFRFPRRQLTAELLDDESRALNCIAGWLSFPVPVPVFQGKQTSEYPWPFVGYPFLEGRSAWCIELNDEQRMAMAEPLGEFLARLHSIPIDRLENVRLRGDELGRLDLSKRIPQTEERLKRLADGNWIESSRPWQELLLELPDEPRPVCLVHGDFYGAHLLLNAQSQLCGIIDWTDVHQGDPAVDLMVVFQFLPARARELFWKAYGSCESATVWLARFRALNHMLALALSAMDKGDEVLRDETLRSLWRIVASEKGING